jgi:hypothetical protein
MTVEDRNGHRIGTVAGVYLGAVDPQSDAMGLGPATADEPPPAAEDPYGTNIGRRLLGDSGLPDTVQSRLLRQGYLRVRTPFAGRYRFVLAEQVHHVEGDRVQLSIPKADLISEE